MHCVLETDAYANAAKQAGLSEDEQLRITTTIAENPMAGDIIPRTGRARKLRFPLGRKGKRSGCRVITYYAADDV